MIDMTISDAEADGWTDEAVQEAAERFEWQVSRDWEARLDGYCERALEAGRAVREEALSYLSRPEDHPF